MATSKGLVQASNYKVRVLEIRGATILLKCPGHVVSWTPYTPYSVIIGMDGAYSVVIPNTMIEDVMARFFEGDTRFPPIWKLTSIFLTEKAKTGFLYSWLHGGHYGASQALNMALSTRSKEFIDMCMPFIKEGVRKGSFPRYWVSSVKAVRGRVILRKILNGPQR